MNRRTDGRQDDQSSSPCHACRGYQRVVLLALEQVQDGHLEISDGQFHHQVGRAARTRSRHYWHALACGLSGTDAKAHEIRVRIQGDVSIPNGFLHAFIED